MTRTLRRRTSISAAAVLAAAAIFVPTAAHAAVSPAVIEAEVSPVSHLGTSPGADESQLGFNWLTASADAEMVQIAPADAQVGDVFPAEAAASFDAIMAPSQDREGLQVA